MTEKKTTQLELDTTGRAESEEKPKLGRPGFEAPHRVKSLNMETDVVQALDDQARQLGISSSKLGNAVIKAATRERSPGKPLEVRTGKVTFEGIEARFASDGDDAEWTKRVRHDLKGKEATIENWTQAAVLFGKWEVVKTKDSKGKTKLKRKARSWRYLELVPGPEFQELHLDDQFYVKGHFEVVRVEHQNKGANDLYKAFKAQLAVDVTLDDVEIG